MPQQRGPGGGGSWPPAPGVVAQKLGSATALPVGWDGGALIVDDSRTDATLLEYELGRAGHDAPGRQDHPFIVASRFLDDQAVRSITRAGADGRLNKNDLRGLASTVAWLLSR